MNEEDRKQDIAMFRFQVIAPFLGLTHDKWGEKEKILKKITEKEWDIPHSGRSFIGRSTVLEWLREYNESGQKLKSLYPKEREDRGRFRSMDRETEQTIISLKQEFPESTVSSLLRIARERNVLPADFSASKQSVYRLLNALALKNPDAVKKDRRRFEAELPNDLWQSDCMHGPMVTVGGKQRKSYLFAFIDDHSRLVPHARFYVQENLECYLDCLKTALKKRGLPRKLYVDNGPSFRSHLLAHITASLGIALIHCTPYTPEGKGKQERWFLTVRTGFLSILPGVLPLEKLNEQFQKWIDDYYHLRIHSSTKEKPIERYLRHIQLIRPAPNDLDDFFRLKAVRRVYKDRTVCLEGRVYEAPLNLIEKRITLLYHGNDLGRVEIVYDGSSRGFLVPLDVLVNSRIKRTKYGPAVVDKAKAEKSASDAVPDGQPIMDGRLFGFQDEEGKRG
jgi:putative transposase